MRMGEAKPRSVVPGGEFAPWMARPGVQRDGATSDTGITAAYAVALTRPVAASGAGTTPTMAVWSWPQGGDGRRMLNGAVDACS